VKNPSRKRNLTLVYSSDLSDSVKPIRHEKFIKTFFIQEENNDICIVIDLSRNDFYSRGEQ